MKVIGLFRELGAHISQTVPGIQSMVNGLPEDEVGSIARYLKSGVPVFDVMGASNDPLDKSVCIPGGPSLVSDGTWIWRNDLVYFVEKYRVKLPVDFVLHAISKDVVLVDDEKVLEKCAEILDAYERAEKGEVL